MNSETSQQQRPLDVDLDDHQPLSNADKKPVVRGARACMVCRAAKMRCIGGDDQASDLRPCNRCKKAGVECRFEKHRRGRKPGSKLPESTKMNRRMEREHVVGTSVRSMPKLEQPPSLSSAMKREETVEYMDVDPSSSASSSNIHATLPQNAREYTASTYPPPEMRYLAPPLDVPSPRRAYTHHPHSPSQDSTSQQRSTVDDDDRSDENVYPSAMYAKEKSRQSFLHTVLGPSAGGPSAPPLVPPKATSESARDWAAIVPSVFDMRSGELPDPIDLNLLTEYEATQLFDRLLVSLNPFVSLFDPHLHTIPYIRKRSKFLLTVLMMAACKFFKSELHEPLQKMAFAFASRAWDEQWKSVETVQAFCCLSYWKEPDDNACRLSVELGLNTYVRPPASETDRERRERRNRERTHLVLFVHDRSLSMQTGRLWMLQEDELVRNSVGWHLADPRPEDVTVAAFVQLRRLSAETSDVFYLRRNSSRDNSDVNYEVLLNGCNTKLTAWMEFWEGEMRKAGGTEFHFCLLRLFRLHVRLFLNSLGLTRQTHPQTGSKDRSAFSIQALSLCYTSAKETLQIIHKFRDLETLRYGQDAITIMSAYAAIFLLRLIRRTPQESQNWLNTHEIRNLIEQTATSFYDGAAKGTLTSSAAAHARFLHNLVTIDRDDERRRRSEAIVRPSSTTTTPIPPLDRGQTDSADSLSSARTEVAPPGIYSPAHLPSNSPISTRPPPPTSSVRSPPAVYSNQPPSRPDGLTISTTIVRPPMLPSAYSTATTTVDSVYYHQQQHKGVGSSSTGSSSSGVPMSAPPALDARNGYGNGGMVDHAYPQRSPTVYASQQQQQQQSIVRYAQSGGEALAQEQQTQMLLQSVPGDPQVEAEYTRQMYEQLGMQGAHLHENVPYIAPATHPHLPSVGDHQMYSFS